MRIGELAELARTTTRAVRHYHAEGLLPEPPRQPNGYRSYGVRDLITLVRVRRLREAGLSLDEVRAVLASPTGSDAWRNAMTVAERRVREEERRLRRLRRELKRQLAAELDPTLPAPLAEVFEELRRAGLPEPSLALEQELLLVSIVYEPAAVEPLVAYYRSVLDKPDARDYFTKSHADFAALADLDPEDPYVAEVARGIADDAIEHGPGLIPDQAAMPADLDDPQVRELFEQFAPAQRRAIELSIIWMTNPAAPRDPDDR